MGETAIGIDIGGTNLRAARISQAGEILARATQKSARDPDLVMARLLELIASVDAPGVAAIGIGVPGRVDATGRTVLSGGYVDLAGIPIADRIEAATGRPVTIDNDCGMALIAEMRLGAARGHANVVMFTIGTGIGGAVAEAGRPVRGRATAGQLGHITVDLDGEPCLCGRRGCVETTSSGTALGRHRQAAGIAPDLSTDELLARGADPATPEAGVLRAFARPLRAAIDSAVAMFDPGLVLLGGGLGHAAHKALAGFPAEADWYRCPVAAAELGDDAGIIGAGLAALSQRPAPLRTTAKRAVLVNGVPASGKSTVSRGLADRTGWPLLSLDTVKDPFLVHLGGGDRAFNRTLGRASYEAIWALTRDAPAGATIIVDAWFGFQPPEVLEAHLKMAGVEATFEVWCHAPPDVVAGRYAARLDQRPAGHPGAAYVPELFELAQRAAPLARGALIAVDTTRAIDFAAIVAAMVWDREPSPEEQAAEVQDFSREQRA